MNWSVGLVNFFDIVIRNSRMNYIERLLKKTLQNAGILIRYYSPASSEEARRLKLIQLYNIDLVFDVGANKGQYGLSLLDAGFKGKIVSFEPLSSAYGILLKQSKPFKSWNIAPRCALGNENKEIEMNISANLVSSTILNMLDTHIKGAPESKIIGKEKADLMKLDNIGKKYIKSNNTYLKIDVQGFEYEVLLGAKEIFPQIKGIELEISVEPLYEGQQWLFSNVLEYTREHNFALHSMTPAFTDNATGKVLQYNGIFFRR